jgi:methyl-accepting chemotaxis protein
MGAPHKSEELRFESLELRQLSADLRRSSEGLATRSAELRETARRIASSTGEQTDRKVPPVERATRP